ncbi:MAG TPA: RluA family pseudouridine synthase [Methylomirabilota bacterium]|nr:RluA family pseudouridine synthase [Methylomirabilota bacterium]
MTLLERLATLFPQASRRSVKHWLEAGRVRVNGGVMRDGRAAVAPTDRVELGSPAAGFPAGLGLVHEDDQILVVDKPPGLLTVATERERVRTAYRLVWDYLTGQHPRQRPFIVHRLDRETGGLLVFAKSVTAKRQLQSQFEARTVERIYRALVEGVVKSDGGTLETRLVQDQSLRVRAARPGSRSRRSGEGGRAAVTHYRVVERRHDTTLLELALGTGRRHQIRVQLADLGHPVVGDPLHATRRGLGGRMCLHAMRLGFVHPATGRPVSFKSGAPPGWL